MRNVLFITGNILPCFSGDSIYSYGNVIRISQFCTVDVLTYYSENFENIDDYQRLVKKINALYKVKSKNNLLFAEKLKRFNIQSYQKDFVVKLEELLNTEKYDCIIIDHLRMTFSYKYIKKSKLNRNSKIILIEHNVEHQNIREEILFRKSSFIKFKLRVKNFRIKKYESSMIRKIKNIWFICEDDKNKILNNFINIGDVKYNIISPNFPYERVKKEDDLKKISYNLVITGSMNWYPNVEGVIWFCKNVFNKLLDKYPYYKLYIVGSNPDPKIKSLESQNIVVTGKVQSTDKYIKKCDFLIVPNRTGSGVKIKILEAIKKGIPVISVKESTAGYSSDIFIGGFCVNNENDFLNSIVELNKNVSKKICFTDKATKIIDDADKVTIEKMKNDLLHW